MKQLHTKTTLSEKWLSNIKYLQNKKQINPLPPQSYLSNFYHPTQGQINHELFFVTVGPNLATCAL